MEAEKQNTKRELLPHTQWLHYWMCSVWMRWLLRTYRAPVHCSGLAAQKLIFISSSMLCTDYVCLGGNKRLLFCVMHVIYYVHICIKGNVLIQRKDYICLNIHFYLGNKWKLSNGYNLACLQSCVLMFSNLLCPSQINTIDWLHCDWKWWSGIMYMYSPF